MIVHDLHNTAQVRKINMLSKTTQKIIQDGIGYRNDNISEIGAAEEIQTVLEYEIEELDNTDIFEFTNHNSIEAIVDDVSKILHSNKIYVLWITSKKGVKAVYPDDYETNQVEEINAYKLPKEYVILSDLGLDGILITSR